MNGGEQLDWVFAYIHCTCVNVFSISDGRIFDEKELEPQKRVLPSKVLYVLSQILPCRPLSFGSLVGRVRCWAVKRVPAPTTTRVIERGRHTRDCE